MKRIETFGSRVYLVNTGWTGGSGNSGKRFPIPITRAIITAITKGQLANCETEHLDMLNLDIPKAVEAVDKSYLNPRMTWANPDEYDVQAKMLAELFVANIKSFDAPQMILNAGPQT